MSHVFFLFRVVVPRDCCQRNDKSLRDAAIATKQTPFPGKWPLENLKLETTRLLQVATSKYGVIRLHTFPCSPVNIVICELACMKHVI